MNGEHVPHESSTLRTHRLALIAVLSALVCVSAAALFCGTVNYSISDVLADSDVRDIILRLRAPRVLFCIFVGGSLSIIGATYQAIFRNPLASPFSLGVSSGAALGASLAMLSRSMSGFVGLDSTACAMCGALVTVLIVLRLTRLAISTQGASLLLTGVVLSFFCSSLLTLIQYLSDYAQLFRVTRWMMGGIMAAGPYETLVAFALSLFVYVWLWLNRRELDLMLFGDELAAVKGVDVTVFYRRAFVVTSLVIGWIVAQCGVIGFVGIVVPAMVRSFTGPGHARLLPIVFLAGALLVVACDLLGRVLIPPYEIPVGVFTAVLGGPLFIWLLVRGKGLGAL